MKKFELNRKQYQTVRKMDHNEMKNYLNSVYEDGYKEGEKSVSEKSGLPDLSGLEEEIQNIRGIGGAKARTVFAVVKGFLDRKVDGSNESGS